MTERLLHGSPVKSGFRQVTGVVVLVWLLLHALAVSADNAKTAAPMTAVLPNTGAKVVGLDERRKQCGMRAVEDVRTLDRDLGRSRLIRLACSWARHEAK
jgi:hypothetical protein